MRTRWLLAACMVALLAVWAGAGLTVAQTGGDGQTSAAEQDQAAPAEPAETAAEPAETADAAQPTAGAGAAAGEEAAAAGEEAAEQDEELTTGEAFLLKLKQGGTTMVFLFLASVAMVGYTIERMINLRSSAIVPDGLAERADELWREERWDELVNLPEKSNSTLARVIAVIARHRNEGMADVSTMAGDAASRDMRRQSQKAYPLAVVATVSPLLGLLGTVIGMIGAFDKVAAAGSLGDASLLGGDISKALITTGTGLSIAVPALVLYHWFKSRTNYYALMLEEEVGALMAAWFGSEAEVAEPKEEVAHAG